MEPKQTPENHPDNTSSTAGPPARAPQGTGNTKRATLASDAAAGSERRRRPKLVVLTSPGVPDLPNAREIETLAEFDEHIAHTDSLRGWFLQSVDLTGRAAELARVDVAGAVFLGCRLDEQTERDLPGRGALLFPQLPDVPFDPYRGTLYAAEELYDQPRYATRYLCPRDFLNFSF